MVLDITYEQHSMVDGSLPIQIFPPRSRPFGQSYKEWTARWWQWLLSIPKPQSPAIDYSGANVNVNQTDPNVFFLCQTIEGVESTPVRKNVLTSKKAILMPIINWLSTINEDGSTDQELRDRAKNKMDVVADLEVTINGKEIKGLHRFRVKSDFFDASLPEDNIFDSPPGRRRSVSDGYWLFFTPLEKNLRLSTFGSCSSGLTKMRVSYDLTIL